MIKLFYITIIPFLLFSQTKTIDAMRIDVKPEIDAHLDQAWESIGAQTDFVMHDPTPLGKPTERTEFRFSYDNDNIYFYIKAYGDPSTITTQEGKRDDAAFNGDWLYIAISPLNDQNSGYAFLVNPSNVQGDARLYNNGWEDWNWDAIWFSETQIESDGWVLEVRIPLRAIKFQATDVQDWGFNMARLIRAKNEKVFWQEINPDIGYKISNFAQLRGIQGIKSRQEILLTPSVVAAFDSDIDYDPTLSNRNLGLDILYNLNETHSILATLKPDFAQIEADADQINLSDYPLFLNEKRPFFLKGSDLYEMPDEIFYSRRMASPDAGVKFFGSVGNLNYGLTYVSNDMKTEIRTENIQYDNAQVELSRDTTDLVKQHKENFLLARVTYNQPDNYQIGYLNAVVNSEYELSGMLHGLDVKYYPQKNLRLTFLAATTVLSDKDFGKTELNRTSYYGSTLTDMKERGNRSLRFQMNYDTDTWYSYFKLQKKSNYFEQGIVGFPEANNKTEQDFNLGRRWRFKDSFWNQFRVNINVNHQGTYDNSVQSFNYNFNTHASHQFEEMGYFGYGMGVNFNDGSFRYYDVPDDVTTRHFDNYGEFVAADNHGVNFWGYIENDFSKKFAFNIYEWFGHSRGYDEVGSELLLQWKPTSAIKIRLNYVYQEIENSKYYDWDGIYRSISVRNEYAISQEIFAKYIIQYNPQEDRLSNNMIVTYEYNRGSFIYLAYYESGVIDDSFNKGTLLKAYDLENRTISLKATYSLYL